jgi:hypothetical protein
MTSTIRQSILISSSALTLQSVSACTSVFIPFVSVPSHVPYFLVFRHHRETKTVNAWFQNKRASAKKRSRGGAPYDQTHLSSNSSSTANTPRQQPDLEDFQDTDYPVFDNHDRPSLVLSLHDTRQQSAFYSTVQEHTQFFTESDNMPRKMRMRPTPHQTEALKRFYKTNPHPSKMEREDLGERIGM